MYNYSFFDDFFNNFNSLFVDFSADKSFPKYNVVKLNDEQLNIEIALAGYTKSDVEVTVKNNIITVRGEKKLPENRVYLHKEIAERAFERHWTLPRSVEVIDAKIDNGILTIECKLIVPENEKVKLIDIK